MSNFFKSVFQKIRDKVVELLPSLVEKAVEALHSLVDKAAAAAKSGLSSLGEQIKIALQPELPVTPEEILTSLEINPTEAMTAAGAVTLEAPKPLALPANELLNDPSEQPASNPRPLVAVSAHKLVDQLAADNLKKMAGFAPPGLPYQLPEAPLTALPLVAAAAA